jgi:uncharacterized protein
MVITDTGFWLALANKRDAMHLQSKVRFSEFKEEGFITTWCVITETCYLLQQRVGINAPTALLNKVSIGALQVFDVTQVHCPRIIGLMNQYHNLPMDLADASLVILAEHLNHGRILSVDQRDFNAYRWKSTQPFQNLLL